MATAAKLTPEQIEISLRSLWNIIDDIPDMAEDWPSLGELERDSYEIEWPDTLSHFRGLIEEAESDRLTDTQHERYERLVRRYQEVVPTIKQLGLSMIPVPNLAPRTR